MAVFNYNNGPSYRCLFPEPPKANEVPNCSQVGVLGVLPGVIGCMQANEALKIILEIGEVLSGKLLVYNALTCQSMTLNVSPNPSTISQTKSMKATFKHNNYKQFCGMQPNPTIAEISAQELYPNIENYTFVDVRELWEQPRFEQLNAIEIPLPRLLSSAQQIPQDKPVIMLCAKGIRSKIAIEELQKIGSHTNLINLTGGMKALAPLMNR